jgi:hypothetical protein
MKIACWVLSFTLGAVLTHSASAGPTRIVVEEFRVPTDAPGVSHHLRNKHLARLKNPVQPRACRPLCSRRDLAAGVTR